MRLKFYAARGQFLNVMHMVKVSTQVQSFCLASPLLKNCPQVSDVMCMYKFLNRIVHAGVNVMITSFCDFPQFSAKKSAFFFNININIVA
jgi:hypothetical protein